MPLPNHNLECNGSVVASIEDEGIKCWVIPSSWLIVKLVREGVYQVVLTKAMIFFGAVQVLSGR